MIVLAIGDQTTEYPPKPIAVGNKPTMVVTEVSMMGLSLVWVASLIASLTLLPSARSSLMKLISTIASFTAIPANATAE